MGVKEVNGHSFDELVPALSSLPIEKVNPMLLLRILLKVRGAIYGK